jgi:hypothetical protein
MRVECGVKHFGVLKHELCFGGVRQHTVQRLGGHLRTLSELCGGGRHQRVAIGLSVVLLQPFDLHGNMSADSLREEGGRAKRTKQSVRTYHILTGLQIALEPSVTLGFVGVRGGHI